MFWTNFDTYNTQGVPLGSLEYFQIVYNWVRRFAEMLNEKHKQSSHLKNDQCDIKFILVPLKIHIFNVQ